MKIRITSSYGRMEFLGVKVSLYLLLTFCFALCGEVSIQAQKDQVISRGSGKPVILKMYDPENQGRDETIIFALLNNPENAPNPSTSGTEGIYPPTFILKNAWYGYPGKNPARPQNVSFTFISDEGNKDKGGLNFSIAIEGAIAHQGEVSLGQLTFQSNGHNITQQTLTVPVPTDIFLLITQAKKVQFKVGPKSHKLNNYQRKAIVALAGTMETESK